MSDVSNKLFCHQADSTDSPDLQAQRLRRILIVRHSRYRKKFFDIILRWTATNFPELSLLFDLRELPVYVTDWSSIALCVGWLQDPVQAWSIGSYQQAARLLAQCDERGIPTLNRVDKLLNATKMLGASLMRGVGLNTPKMALISDREEFCRTLGGLTLPLFIREDWGHSGRIHRVSAQSDLCRIPWRRFKRPVAIELMDVRDPRDSMYRKYRYLAAGDIGVSLHLQISRVWITRGRNRILSPENIAEELHYISHEDLNHAEFQRARRVLGLDLVAFDYGYTSDGRMIVWEANPFPHIQFATKWTYRNGAIHRALLAILYLYQACSKIPFPSEITEALSFDLAELQERFRTAARQCSQ